MKAYLDMIHVVINRMYVVFFTMFYYCLLLTLDTKTTKQIMTTLKLFLQQRPKVVAKYGILLKSKLLYCLSFNVRLLITPLVS
jgi:hypothetical protein